MIVSQQQRAECYKVADSHTLGRRLISQEGRKTITDKTIEEFQKQMNFDPYQFTKEDRELITKKVKDDPGVVQFVIIPTIIMAVVGWMVSKLLDALWDWWNKKGRLEQGF